MNSTLKLSVIICLYTALNLPYLATFPPVNYVGDESVYLNTGTELLTTGRPAFSAFPHTLPEGEVWVFTPWIYNSLLALFFSLFGPGVWAGRLLSFLCGAGVIALAYRFGKDIMSQKAGLLASLLLSTSIFFSWHGRELRPEMLLLFFTTGSIYFLYRAWQERKDRFLFLSGLISTLALQVHPNSIIVTVSLLLIYIVLYRSRLFTRSTISLFSGLFLGSAIWVIFNYLPYTLSSFQTSHKKYTPPVFQASFLSLLKYSLLNLPEFFTSGHINFLTGLYRSSFGKYMIYFSLFLVSAGFLIGRNKKQMGFMLSFFVMPLFIKNFLTGSWNWFHNSVLLSVSYLAVAMSVMNISDRLRSERLKKLFPLSVVIVIAFFGVWDIMANNIDMMQYDYDAFMERVSSEIPAGSTVLGDPIYYPAFVDRDKRFVSYSFLEERCPGFSDEIKDLDIDYIIMDFSFRIFSTFWCSDRYYNEQVKDFLKKNASLVKTIKTRYPRKGILLKSVLIFKVNR
jgi:4-amino-4-deoxy-L-arabinose transferase-like glycosyltransferase